MTMFYAAILFLLEPQKLFTSSQQNNTILAILIEMDHASQADSLQTKETLKSSEGYHPTACLSEDLHKLGNLLTLNHFVPLLIGKTKRILQKLEPEKISLSSFSSTTSIVWLNGLIFTSDFTNNTIDDVYQKY